jgi:two-component sensor histidine kinase
MGMPQPSASFVPAPPPPEGPDDLRERVAELESELRELQHRAKNSLQLVLSLLRLQSGRVSDPDARAAYDHTLLLIDALAVLYRQLHEHGEGTHIDAGVYLRALAESIRQAVSPARSAIPVLVSAEPVAIRLYEAMPLGLIVAELVSNGLGHAFPPNPRIRIVVADIGAGRARLTVESNGRPLPVGFDDGASDGLMLAEALAMQLGDSLATEIGPDGTRATVTFPV